MKILKNLFCSDNIFPKIFRWAFIIVISNKVWNLFNNCPECFNYGNEIYHFFQFFLSIFNIIAVALIGAVAFFYIQEYRTVKRYRNEYENIAKNLGKVLKTHLINMRFDSKANFSKKDTLGLKGALGLKTKEINKLSFVRQPKDLTDNIEIAEKINYKISKSERLPFSKNELKRVSEIETSNSENYEIINECISRAEISFEKIEKNIKEIVKEKFSNNYSLRKENYNSNYNYFNSYESKLKRILKLYIYIVKILHKPKLKILKEL